MKIDNDRILKERLSSTCSKQKSKRYEFVFEIVPSIKIKARNLIRIQMHRFRGIEGPGKQRPCSRLAAVSRHLDFIDEEKNKVQVGESTQVCVKY